MAVRTQSRRGGRVRRAPVRSPLELELARLKGTAARAAEALGHQLTAWVFHRYHPSRSSAVCRRCGRPLVIDVRPGPGEQELMGELLTATCGEGAA